RRSSDLDARGSARCGAAVGGGAGCVYLAGSDALRLFDVRAGAKVAGAQRCAVCGGVVRGESVSPGSCLLAKRPCGAAGRSVASVALVVRAACGRGRTTGTDSTQRRSCGSVANQCSGGSDGELFVGAVGGGGRGSAAL